MRNFLFQYVTGGIGAILGGVLGTLGFILAYRQGFYMMVLPGALVGWGAGFLSNQPSRVRGILCAIGALGLSLYLEWTYLSTIADFWGFLQSLPQLGGLTWIMIALGTFLGYWWGREELSLNLPGKSRFE